MRFFRGWSVKWSGGQISHGSGHDSGDVEHNSSRSERTPPFVRDGRGSGTAVDMSDTDSLLSGEQDLPPVGTQKKVAIDVEPQSQWPPTSSSRGSVVQRIGSENRISSSGG